MVYNVSALQDSLAEDVKLTSTNARLNLATTAVLVSTYLKDIGKTITEESFINCPNIFFQIPDVNVPQVIQE